MSFHSKEELPEQYYNTKQQDTTLQKKHWTDLVQCNQGFEESKPIFMEMKMTSKFVWSYRLCRIMVEVHRFVLNPPQTHFSLYRAGPMHKEFESV